MARARANPSVAANTGRALLGLVFRALEGKNVNLKIVEKENMPILNEWADSLDVGDECAR